MAVARQVRVPSGAADWLDDAVGRLWPLARTRGEVIELLVLDADIEKLRKRAVWHRPGRVAGSVNQQEER